MEDVSGVPRPTRGSEVKTILDAERSEDPFLVVRDGDGNLRAIALVEAPFIVGRLGSSSLSLSWDEEVSRVHAELLKLGDSWVVADDNLSRNGTFIGGERVAGRRVLEDGDVIRFGATLAVFRNPGESGAHGTTVAAGAVQPPDLTSSQLKVVRALCRPVLEGNGGEMSPATNKEISDELFLSLDAVKGHLRVLFTKFDVADLPQNRKRSALVNRAIQAGVVGK